MIDRFDIPEEIKNIINLIVKADIIDAVEIYSMAVNHGENWDDLVNEIVNILYAQRLSNQEGSKVVQSEIDNYWMVKHADNDVKPEVEEEKEEETQFTLGNYATSSICDSNCIFEYEITKRTAKNVWVKSSMSKEPIRKKVYLDDEGTEFIYPDGQYSMCTVLRPKYKV